MKGLNEVKLIGNLGSEPEMRFTPTGKAVTTFSMATGRKYRDEQDNLVEDTTWHNVVCWEKTAEAVNKSLNKGAAVYVSGRLSNREWQGQDGQKHYRTEIVANDVIFLDKPVRQKSDNPETSSLGDEVALLPSNNVGGVTQNGRTEPSNLAKAAIKMGATPLDI